MDDAKTILPRADDELYAEKRFPQFSGCFGNQKTIRLQEHRFTATLLKFSDVGNKPGNNCEIS